MNGSIRSRPGDDRAGNRYSAEPARADLFHRFDQARVWIGDETKDTLGPAVGFVPQNTKHYVNNIGDVPSSTSTSAFGRSQLRNRMAANGANRRAPW
jgi:hypothetical protein